MTHERNSPAEIHQQLRQLCQSAEALKIVEIAKNDKAPIHRFAQAISTDPLFVARLLRVANFIPGLTQQLTTIPQALNVLGLDNLKPLALGLSAFMLDPRPLASATREVDGAIGLRDLWEHALGSAAVAARFAARFPNVSPLTAFTAGFIHDSGKVLLYRYSKESFVEAISVVLEKNVPSTEGEMLAFGTDHVKASQEWCRAAELPPALEHVLRFHHDRLGMLPDFVDDESRCLIAIVQAADLTCESQNIGKAGDRDVLSKELRMTLNFREEEWRDPIQAVKHEVVSARLAFGFQRQDKKLPSDGPQPVRSNGRSPLESQKAAPRGQVIPFPPRAEEPGRNNARPDSGKLAILVVEDHSSLCDLLSLYLMRHGYHVRTASNGEGALDILSKEEIHLVLLDLMLPRVDGFEVLRQLHKTQRNRTPYIIVVSAGASERDRKKVLELGADEYMPKPFHLMRLLERIQVVEKYLL